MRPRPRIYPVGLVLDGQPCLVVGGDEIAARKAAGLVAAGAKVTVIAPDISPAFAGLDVEVEIRCYRSGDVAPYRLVITATGDRDVDSAIYLEAKSHGIFVNSADDPDNCSMFLPAVLRRGPVTVSVSTDGSAPALASWLRDAIAELVDERTEMLAETVSSIRSELRARGHSTLKFDWSALIDSLDRANKAGGQREVLVALSGEWLNAELVRLSA